MSKRRSSDVAATQAEELAALAALPDEAIDTSDAPERVDWSDAEKGRFYRPVKRQLTLRLDADVIAWFRGNAGPQEGYQTHINRALRDYVRARRLK